MRHPGTALQKALYNRLLGYAPLIAELGGNKVYDTLPQTTATPYVVIGDDTGVNWDTKTDNGWNYTTTIHVFTEDIPGKKAVKTLLGHVYDALHSQEANIILVGFNLVACSYDFETSYLEPGAEGASDKYWHGVIRFRFLIDI